MIQGMVSDIIYGDKTIQCFCIDLNIKDVSQIYVKGTDILRISSNTSSTSLITNVRSSFIRFFNDISFDEENIIIAKIGYDKQFALFVKLEDLIYSESPDIPAPLKLFLEEEMSSEESIIALIKKSSKLGIVRFKDERLFTKYKNTTKETTEGTMDNTQMQAVTDTLIQNMQKEINELKERNAELVKKANELYEENIELKNSIGNTVQYVQAEPVITLQSLVDFLKVQGVSLSISPA